VVEQRNTYFKRMGHAHAIDFREDVQRQVSVKIKILSCGEPISLVAEQTHSCVVERIFAGHFGQYVTMEELLTLRFAKECSGIEIAIPSCETVMDQEVSTGRAFRH